MGSAWDAVLDALAWGSVWACAAHASDVAGTPAENLQFKTIYSTFVMTAANHEWLSQNGDADGHPVYARWSFRLPEAVANCARRSIALVCRCVSVCVCLTVCLCAGVGQTWGMWGEGGQKDRTRRLWQVHGRSACGHR